MRGESELCGYGLETFDEQGRMKESSMRDRVMDFMEGLIKLIRINREFAMLLTDRFSDRKE